MWQSENRITDGHQIVFPWTAVAITHEGASPVVADPSSVMFYNKGQRYRRQQIAERGDICVFFRLDDKTMLDIVSEFDPTVGDHPETPFVFSHAPGDARLYYRHHKLFGAAQSIGKSQPLQLYECAVEIVRNAVALSYASRHANDEWSAIATSSTAHRDAVIAARSFVATHFANSLTINDVAAHVGLSPYHLCRIYRRLTGQTIHGHLTQTRLCASLEPVAEGSTPLATLAVQLGFSDQAHFTNLFRRQFGLPPAAARREFAQGTFSPPSKNLQDTSVLDN